MAENGLNSVAMDSAKKITSEIKPGVSPEKPSVKPTADMLEYTVAFQIRAENVMLKEKLGEAQAQNAIFKTDLERAIKTVNDVVVLLEGKINSLEDGNSILRKLISEELRVIEKSVNIKVFDMHLELDKRTHEFINTLDRVITGFTDKVFKTLKRIEGVGTKLHWRDWLLICSGGAVLAKSITEMIFYFMKG